MRRFDAGPLDPRTFDNIGVGFPARANLRPRRERIRRRRRCAMASRSAWYHPRRSRDGSAHSGSLQFAARGGETCGRGAQGFEGLIKAIPPAPINANFGIGVRRGIMCAHREGAYKRFAPRTPLSQSEHAQDRCILLPLYAQMTVGEQHRVASVLAKACASQQRRVA